MRQLDNGTFASSEVEGLLYVTLVGNQTKEERTGTVCMDDFNTRAAALFCQHMGNHDERPIWGSLSDYKYVPA